MDKTTLALAIAGLAATGALAPSVQAEEPLVLDAEQMDAVTAGARAESRFRDLEGSAEAEGDQFAYTIVGGYTYAYAVD